MARKASRSSITKKAWVTRRAKLYKTTIGLGNVDNTSDDTRSDTSSIRSIADDMDEAISNLEMRLRATTKRINSIMKV